VTSSFEVIEGIEDECELGKPSQVEASIFDIGVKCFQLDIGVELVRSLLRDEGL
jgi:hypothetical protein